MKTIITILTAITLSLLAINGFTNSHEEGKCLFQNKSVNLNRKKVAEVLRKMNEAKGYTLTEESLCISYDIQAFSFYNKTFL